MSVSPRIERLLYGHVLTDREAQAVVNALRVVAATGVTLAAAYFAVLAWVDAAPVRYVIAGFSLLSTGFAYLLARRRRFLLGSALMLGALLVTVTVAAALGGGIDSPALSGYVAGVLLGGLLVGGRATWLMAALGALAITLLAFGRSEPHFDALALGTTSSRWGIELFTLAGAAALVHYGWHVVRGVVDAAQANALKLEERNVELEEIRQRFQHLLDNANDLILERAPDGRVLYASASASRFRGAPLAGYTTMDGIHPEDAEAVQSALEEIVSAGRNASSVLYRARRSDGAWRWVETMRTLYRTVSGEPRILSISRDVTERQEAREGLERRVAERTRELEVANEQLRREGERRERMLEVLRRSEQLASIGTLAAGLAHEINNPVGSILVSADFARSLNRCGESRAEVDAQLANIATEARRCGRVVKSVLAYARASETEKWIGDLNEVVRDARDHLGGFVQARGGKLELELGDHLAPFAMNPIEIEQVIVNLVRNALSPDRSGASVWIRTELTSSGTRLTVRDDGPGIPAQARDRIFEPFFTTESEGGGVGLGLSIVHGIVTAHGGRLRVESQEGQGTRFVMDFPALEAVA